MAPAGSAGTLFRLPRFGFRLLLLVCNMLQQADHIAQGAVGNLGVKGGGLGKDRIAISIVEKVPTGMWNANANAGPSVADDRYIGAVTGMAVHPKAPPKLHQTHHVKAGNMRFHVEEHDLATEITGQVTYQASNASGDLSTRSAAFSQCFLDAEVASPRANMIDDLGFSSTADVDLSDGLIGTFVEPPVIVTATTAPYARTS
ncbi:MAG: hypothetical protein GY948_12905 [Alphaproteobacteria bacterium]|nr:hypothetical protein [Alphaproteobacteria bacterium]